MMLKMMTERRVQESIHDKAVLCGRFIQNVAKASGNRIYINFSLECQSSHSLKPERRKVPDDLVACVEIHSLPCAVTVTCSVRGSGVSKQGFPSMEVSVNEEAAVCCRNLLL